MKEYMIKINPECKYIYSFVNAKNEKNAIKQTKKIMLEALKDMKIQDVEEDYLFEVSTVKKLEKRRKSGKV